MNIDKIKEFIALRQELYATGVIAVNMREDEVHVMFNELKEVENVQVEKRSCEEYPYKIFYIEDGIKIFCIVTSEQLEESFPRFSGYLVEDIKFYEEELA